MQGETTTKPNVAVPPEVDQQVIAAAVRRGEIIQQVSADTGEIAIKAANPTINFTSEHNVYHGQGDFIIA